MCSKQKLLFLGSLIFFFDSFQVRFVLHCRHRDHHGQLVVRACGGALHPRTSSRVLHHHLQHLLCRSPGHGRGLRCRHLVPEEEEGGNKVKVFILYHQNENV